MFVDALDEFVDGGEDRAASPLDWDKQLARLQKQGGTQADLHLAAFTLLRGGDLFEGGKKKKTPADLVSKFADENLTFEAKKIAKPEREAALSGALRVLSGHPAICRRMLLARPMRMVVIPKDRDFREFGFPRHTNPNAAGIFWNSPKEKNALLALREEYVLKRPHLMVHEMMHAVHFLAFTEKERKLIDDALLPVYRNRRWVEEAVAIYAEKAFGAKYEDGELRAPGLYGKTRRDWHPRHMFSLFMAELLRP